MAMASVNKVFLMGNLTRDPELRYTTNGVAVADLGVAVNRAYTTKDGERREEVTFIDVTVWNRQAENCCQFLKKGRPIHVEGYLKLDSWDDKTSGEKRTKLKVEAENVQFLGSRRDEPEGNAPQGGEVVSAPAPRRSSPPSGNGANGPARGSYNAPNAAPRRPATPPAETEADDDIPF